jgi:hypothetical protein
MERLRLLPTGPARAPLFSLDFSGAGKYDRTMDLRDEQETE